MIEAIQVFVRYEIPLVEHNDEGVKRVIPRRQFNEKFGKPAPDVEVPEAGKHLWDWYFDISERVGRVRDGCCSPIPPTEWLAWKELTGYIVHRREFAILAAMDMAYCSTLNKELAASRKPTG